MTVCIAAIYNNNSIIGVSDRMLTSGSGDIEFEPPAKKIFQVTRCIAILIAGDSSIQAQLLAVIQKYIDERIKTEPEKYIPVADVAERYRDAYINLRKKRAEIAILAKLDMDYDTFINRQQKMSDDFISGIKYDLQNYSLDDGEIVATIITGIDETGPHIFMVRDDYLSNNDNVGFAAVGIGGSHARSHLMLSGHSRFTDEAKALLTVHQAKKKSEVSPGVGKATDMFLVGPGPDPIPGTFYWLEPEPQGPFKKDIVKDLDKFYDNYVKRNIRSNKTDEVKIQKYLANLNESSTTEQATPQPIEISKPEEVKVSEEVNMSKKGGKRTPQKIKSID